MWTGNEFMPRSIRAMNLKFLALPIPNLRKGFQNLQLTGKCGQWELCFLLE